MTKSLLIIFTSLLVFSTAWWETGHMLTAQVAYQELQRINMTTYSRATDIVQSMNTLCNNLSQTFVQSAPWMDDIKEEATDFWYSWHYYNRPVNPQGLFLTQSEDESIYNGVNAMQRAIEALRFDNGQNTVTKAIFMRMIIHIIGDMHQPLHSSEMYNLTYPTGDLGGNLEYIYTTDGQKTRLHSYFDAGAMKLTPSDDYLVRPLNDSAVAFMEQWAQNLTQKYPRSYFGDRLNVKQVYNWTQESWNISLTHIYSYFLNTNKVSDDYQKLAEQLVEEQVVIGGYRMADFIEEVLSNKISPTFEVMDMMEKQVAINEFRNGILELKGLIPMNYGETQQEANTQNSNKNLRREFLKN